jgi:hypothetical protein
MQYTIGLLVNGDPNVLEYYRLAVDRWKQIWSRPESSDIISLATLLSSEQIWFEQNCGSRRVGREIMVLSGIGMLYTTPTGFDEQIERAQLLYSAFQRSYCDLEVKGIARDMAEYYGLLQVQFA